MGRPEPGAPRHGRLHARGQGLTAPRLAELPAAAISATALGAVATGAIAGAAAEPGAPTLCPLRLAAGVPCPFCGLTRSLLAVGEGDLGRAFELHPLGLIVPLAAAWFLLALGRALRSRAPFSWPRPLVALGAVLIAASWIVQLEKGVT